MPAHERSQGRLSMMRVAPPRLLSLAVVGAIAVTAAMGRASALPPAGSDVLPIAGVVDATTLAGTQHIALTGLVTIDHAAPRVEGGVEVVDLTVADLELRGASQLGAVMVTDRGGSRGELRGLTPGQQFPASMFIDLYANVSAPDSPLGPLALHNQQALHLSPRAAGREAPIDRWPPLGVTLHFDDGGAQDACIPLVDEQGAQGTVGLCVQDVTLGIAPALPSYSVRRGGPGHLHPADILGLTPGAPGDRVQAPFVRFTCHSLGLTDDGCDAGADGTQDDVDALSYGHDLTPGVPAGVDFSVGPTAQGVDGSAVSVQRACPPARPGLSPEAEPDVFSSALDGTNALLFDGNGPVGSCTPAFPLGLIESASTRDDLDALDLEDSSVVDSDGNGVPDQPLYFSLDASSPSLAAWAASPADILATVGGAKPVRYASAAQLGLLPGDDIDALCLRESGDALFGAGDLLLFSLTPGSPTLAAISAGPGDLLAPGSPPRVAVQAAALGLLAQDDVDAASCQGALASRQGDGDVDCNGVTNSVDAALVLQRDASLIDALSCAESADVNKDGTVDSMDAAVILRFVAGLSGRLPVTA